MVSISTSGSFKNTLSFLNKFKNPSTFNQIVEKYAQEGVAILSSNTPKKTGVTASSWDYEIEYNVGSAVIHWTNSNVHNGVNIAVILEYGHGTGTGGYVQGIDYINPSTQKLFRSMADEMWREVTKS